MAELLIRGTGRPPQCRDEALAAQAAWVAHRRRKVAAQAMLANQIHGQLDLIFPGLTGCFSHGLDAASLPRLHHLPAPTDRTRQAAPDSPNRGRTPCAPTVPHPGGGLRCVSFRCCLAVQQRWAGG